VLCLLCPLLGSSCDEFANGPGSYHAWWTLRDDVLKIQKNVWKVLWSHRPAMCWLRDNVAVALEMESSR